MSTIRRSKPVVSTKGAITPDFATSPQPAIDPAKEIAWLKQLLAAERRRHGSSETILTRYIASLERQVEDLRRLYFSTITVTTSEKR